MGRNRDGNHASEVSIEELRVELEPETSRRRMNAEAQVLESDALRRDRRATRCILDAAGHGIGKRHAGLSYCRRCHLNGIMMIRHRVVVGYGVSLGLVSCAQAGLECVMHLFPGLL